MALTIGSRLGVYDVAASIGEGGMGRVFRARDTTLNRDVALKVLPDSFIADPDRLARFTREAQTLAALNHPNIAAIYGLEESGGVRALVMELVEGEDLSQRIARGAIPIDEALPIATQIAEALEAAHEQGIIHRDLKPANIKVRRDGTVKVLDFGLAKAMEPTESSSPSTSRSPTITSPAMTQAGMILGTAAYMAPEQARGKTVDKRADIWAFGCVLFEMLTGQRAFDGEDMADTLGNVLKVEPSFQRLPASMPPRVVQVIRACLQKHPKQRIESAQDVRLALEGAFETVAPLPTTTPVTASGGRLAWVAFAVVAVLAAAMTMPTVQYLREGPPPALPERRVDIVTPATDRPTDFALSPDGQQIVFVASGEGGSRLWLRSLTMTAAQPLTGTDGARLPFWAPDGRAIGFFAGAALKRLDLNGGAPQILAPVAAGQGATWNADGVIVFVQNAAAPLMRMSATGGAATAVTTLGPQQLGHSQPRFLPDGRRLLFYVSGRPDTAGIYLGALDTTAPTRLTPADGAGEYLPEDPGHAGALPEGGWLLWVRAGTLVAQRFDAAKAALAGEPVTLADGVAVDAGNHRSAVSVAATGLVTYRTGGGSPRQLTWLDRAGTARGTVGDLDSSLSNPRVSHDGRRVVVQRTVRGNEDLWLLDGARATRFTFDPAGDARAVWSPDDTRIVFMSSRTRAGNLLVKLTSGTGAEDRLLTADQIQVPTSWSADGRFLLYLSVEAETSADLWIMSMTGERTPSVFLKTPFREAWGAFSPDGHWVAYQSDESGRPEIYVRPFGPRGGMGTAAPAAGQWQVSTSGGVFPLWRLDGKELYYLDPSGAMMAAPVAATGSTFAPGTPVRLFATRIVGGGTGNEVDRQYDVAPDGRFLINTELDSATAPITLLMNWNPEAKK